MKASEASQVTIDACRRLRLSFSTERDYAGWVRRFVGWVGGDQQRIGLSPEDRVSGFLSEIAPRSAASTQNQALNALVFFYKSAINEPLGRLPDWVKAKRPRRLPVWLADTEVRRVLGYLRGATHTGCALMYGSGLRVNEAARLRWRALNFEQRTITVRGGKGDKDRTTCLPEFAIEELLTQRRFAEVLWREDRQKGVPGVQVPDDVGRKYPGAGERFDFFWVFPAAGLSRDPRSGTVRRHHVIDDTFANALRLAARRAAITMTIAPHALRHSFATEYLLQGGTIHELKELLGHASIQTTEIYLHCLPQLGGRVRSPLDRQAGNIVPMSYPAPFQREGLA